MHIEWKVKAFSELTTKELYEMLRLRSEVFVVEQKCTYLDMDNADQQAVHVLGYLPEGLAAGTRLFAPGIRYDMASIGRVVTAPFARGKGIGRSLMERSIAVLEELWGPVAIKISAQLYLQKFYESLGFKQSSDMYLEDHIPHIAMIRTPA
ncbi:GNAT family N-acetyltransferase [Chitinophaga lutea]